jgi:hypothetical protein
LVHRIGLWVPTWQPLIGSSFRGRAFLAAKGIQRLSDFVRTGPEDVVKALYWFDNFMAWKSAFQHFREQHPGGPGTWMLFFEVRTARAVPRCLH